MQRNPGISGPVTEANLSGNLWYSKKQYKHLRDSGRDRTFGRLAIDGRIVEYTELISFEMLQENPGDICPIDDAVFLGQGSFSHFMDLKGNEY
jgi:hypothetical protein